MIQALIATLIEVVALLFAIAAGGMAEEAKTKNTSYRNSFISIALSIVMAICALGVAAR